MQSSAIIAPHPSTRQYNCPLAHPPAARSPTLPLTVLVVVGSVEEGAHVDGGALVGTVAGGRVRVQVELFYLVCKVAHFRLVRELACAYTASPLARQQRVAPRGCLVIPTQRAVVAVVQRIPRVLQSHLLVPVALY